MSPESISAAASVIGVLIAIRALVVQDRRTQFSNAVAIAAQLDSRFEAQEFREARRLAARYMLKQDTSPQALESLLTVLNFFDTVGFLVRKGALTSEIAWHHFGSWITPYTQTAASVIERQRQFDLACFEDLIMLAKEITAIDRTKRLDSSANKLIAPAATTRFLEAEAS